jgi:hypothetical protein
LAVVLQVILSAGFQVGGVRSSIAALKCREINERKSYVL